MKIPIVSTLINKTLNLEAWNLIQKAVNFIGQNQNLKIEDIGYRSESVGNPMNGGFRYVFQGDTEISRKFIQFIYDSASKDFINSFHSSGTIKSIIQSSFYINENGYDKLWKEIGKNYYEIEQI